MKNIRLYIKSALGLSLFVLLGQSCIEREIPSSELPDFVDKIVVNSSVDNVNPISIEVSNSAGAYTTDLPEVVSDADLILTDFQGREIPLIYQSSSRSFVANESAEPGQIYDLYVSRKNMITIRARCQVPDVVMNKSVGYIEKGGVDVNGLPSDRVFIKFVDPAGNNYYSLHFYYYSKSADLFVPFEFEKTDATLGAATTLELNDGGYLFDDKLFNGRTKEFSVVPPSGLVAANTDIKYLVELRSVSSDYYKYYKTLQLYKDNQDFQNNGPFGSAVIVHSNVSGGLGAFIGSTLESDTLR